MTIILRRHLPRRPTLEDRIEEVIRISWDCFTSQRNPDVPARFREAIEKQFRAYAEEVQKHDRA